MKAGLMLAVNKDSVREENDFYATDPAAIRLALPTFREVGLSGPVWECACGAGHLSAPLREAGYSVRSTDLIDRGCGDALDFLSADEPWNGDILTNPPFKLAEAFIRHSMDILEDGRKAFFFLKIQFLQSVDRNALFETYPPKYILINSQRIFCAMNGEFERYAKWSEEKGMWTGGTQCFIWIVFEKGWSGQTTVKWI